MDRTGILDALTLISSFWTNAKTPQNDEEIESSVLAWKMLFETVPNQAVHTEIARLASSGREFPPAPGQIYAAIKERREKQKALPSADAMTTYHDRIMQEYRDAGVSTPSEAKRQGMKFTDYDALCKAHGV